VSCKVLVHIARHLCGCYVARMHRAMSVNVAID
jgi:hypothetical protein